jgi:hypothetical protein
MKALISLFTLLVCLGVSACAQETVFNVPSGDVLDRGKVYAELDVTYQHLQDVAGFTPRVVVGLGKRIEAGVNINDLTTDSAQLNITPTVKWKAYDGKKSGWAFVVGDDVFIPVQNRSYDAGNYVYAEFVKSWHRGTRVTFGGHHFTQDVVAAAQRAGAQLAFEQTLNKRVIFATDWYTGGHALGYVTPGLILKATSNLTLYGTYQIGNRGASDGNHQLLVELGWNMN